MKTVLLCVIAASVLCAVSSLPGRRQYHFVYEPKNWTEARTYCREKHTDLATIDSLEDVNTLNQMVDTSRMVDFHGYNAWIGLYLDMNIWTWSGSGRHFHLQHDTPFTNWADGEPNAAGGQENCSNIYDDGRWNDLNCSSRLTAICSDVKGTNVTYVFINTSMSWFEAQRFCRAHHTDLANVTNMLENQNVQKLVPPGTKTWFGLYMDWRWTDGCNSSFRYWNEKQGEPNNIEKNENCVVANFKMSGQWGDWNCSQRKAFICYRDHPISHKVTVRLKLVNKSSLDPNDPAVMENMLHQLKQKLKEQGVDEDVRLTWRKQADGNVFYKDQKHTKKKKDEL